MTGHDPGDSGTVQCSWCEREATTYLVSDRDSHRSVDAACQGHADEWAHIYRRAVPIPGAILDLTQRAPDLIDLTEALPLAREAAANLDAERRRRPDDVPALED